MLAVTHTRRAEAGMSETISDDHLEEMEPRNESGRNEDRNEPLTVLCAYRLSIRERVDLVFVFHTCERVASVI